MCITMTVAAGLKANFGRDSEIAASTIGAAVVLPTSVKNYHQIQNYQTLP